MTTIKPLNRSNSLALASWGLVGLTAVTSALADNPAYTPPDSPRATYNFNPGWKFIKQDASGAETSGSSPAK